MSQRFILNEVSYFGAGCRKELPAAMQRLGLKKALVCSDKGLIKVGTTAMVTDVLTEAGIPFEIYSEIKPSDQRKAGRRGIQSQRSRLFGGHWWRFVNGHSQGHWHCG